MQNMTGFRVGGALTFRRACANATKTLCRWSNAFTLAEVLITLGIIGVVAALTIPTLISNYNKKVVETRLVQFYSTINQAVKLSEIENGDHKNWDEVGLGCDFDAESKTCKAGSELPFIWFNKYLANYLKVAKVEAQTYNTELGRTRCIIYFNNGSAFALSRFSTTFFPNASDIVPCNSASSGMNCAGTKSFNFYFYQVDGKNAFEPYDVPYNGQLNDDIIRQNCAGTGWNTGVGTGAYCTLFISRNGWKIPDDYPIKF